MASLNHLFSWGWVFVVVVVTAQQTADKSTAMQIDNNNSVQNPTGPDGRNTGKEMSPSGQITEKQQKDQNGSAGDIGTPKQTLETDMGLGEMFAELAGMFNQSQPRQRSDPMGLPIGGPTDGPVGGPRRSQPVGSGGPPVGGPPAGSQGGPGGMPAGQFMNMFRALGQQRASQVGGLSSPQNGGQASMWSSGQSVQFGNPPTPGWSNRGGTPMNGMGMLRGMNTQQRGPQTQGFGGQGGRMAEMIARMFAQGRGGPGVGNMLGGANGPPGSGFGGQGMPNVYGAPSFGQNSQRGGPNMLNQRGWPSDMFNGLGAGQSSQRGVPAMSSMFSHMGGRQSPTGFGMGNMFRNQGAMPSQAAGNLLGRNPQDNRMGSVPQLGFSQQLRSLGGLHTAGQPPNAMQNMFSGAGGPSRSGPPPGFMGMTGPGGAPGFGPGGPGGPNNAFLSGIVQSVMSRMGAPTLNPSPPKPKPVFCNEYDCPPFTVLKTGQNYELRRYKAMTFAAADIADEEYAKIKVYWTLAQYIIQGENEEALKMPITVPILIKNDTSASSGNRTMYFLLPYLRQNKPPRPKHPWLRIVHMPAMNVYVRPVTGFLSDSKFEEQAESFRGDLGPSNPTLPNVTIRASYDTMFNLRPHYNEIWLVSRFEGEEQVLMSVSKNYTKPVTRGEVIHNIFLGQDERRLAGLQSADSVIDQNINQTNRGAEAPPRRQGQNALNQNPAINRGPANSNPPGNPTDAKMPNVGPIPNEGARQRMPPSGQQRNSIRPEQIAIDAKKPQNINFVDNSKSGTSNRGPPRSSKGGPPNADGNNFPGFVARPGFNIF